MVEILTPGTMLGSRSRVDVGGTQLLGGGDRRTKLLGGGNRGTQLLVRGTAAPNCWVGERGTQLFGWGEHRHTTVGWENRGTQLLGGENRDT